MKIGFDHLSIRRFRNILKIVIILLLEILFYTMSSFDVLPQTYFYYSLKNSRLAMEIFYIISLKHIYFLHFWK